METIRKILIIDDDLDFQLMVGNMLRASGYIVKTQLEGNISTAIQFASTCDVILLDFELPGANGVEISKKLKSLRETLHIPIIFLTAQPDCNKLFIESRANALIRKPFSLSLLINKVKELLSIETQIALS